VFIASFLLALEGKAMALLLGYDVGSSSIKATLLDADTGKVLASATSPEKELEIIAVKPGWAEQHPQTWWDNVVATTAKVRQQAQFSPPDVNGIGISYQMHGLVCIDKSQNVLRPAIIWCDSRVVEIGEKAFSEIGEKRCLERLLNSPGNFTASKLKWVKDNEPDIYAKIQRIMLPGDYVAMRMTGQVRTTPSGLSEGILWDFQEQGVADVVLDYYGISKELIAEVIPTFGVQGELTSTAAEELGLAAGTVISYRAGDQPNNALSLNVLNPGEIAATAGTSGVVYGISDKPDHDPKSRVNTFVHVNHTSDAPRYGVLLCLNGTGILNSWLRHNTGDMDYPEMNELAGRAPIGSEGLLIYPYGNGAERTLGNRNLGAAVENLNFNIHKKQHLLRAAQEGIVFALNYGLEIMRGVGVRVRTVRAGNANMFLSRLFAQTFATVTGAAVELYDTDGSQGAARGAGIGAGVYKDVTEAFVGLEPVRTVEPDGAAREACEATYVCWHNELMKKLEA
jgi:xylulokinase